jgi:K+-sensing histidine kinase KdpD
MTQLASRHRITRAFSEIAHTLECGDDANERIIRTLGLLQELVPYRQCALLTAISRTKQELYVLPEPVTEGERRALSAKLSSVLRVTVTSVDSSDGACVSDRVPHLTLPVIGLDRVIGVFRVEPAADVTYDADHVGLVSIVCAQLGGYLTGLSLREDQARRLHDLQSAHDFQRLLVGVVGHDLRNPLSVILAGASVLQHTAAGPETQLDVARRITKNVRRAARIIDDLLDLTQIQLAGGLQLRRSTIDLREMAEEIAADTQLAHPNRVVRVESSADHVHVKCDPDRMSQVITNLVTNAVRYAADGTPVRIRLAVEGDDAVVRVENHGPTIPPDLLPHIFDPFKRGPRRTGQGPNHGLGLGLYIVAEIVRSHGGRIVAESADENTTFTVSLPLSATRSESGELEPRPAFSAE